MPVQIGALQDDRPLVRVGLECGCVVVHDREADAWRVECLVVTDYRPLYGEDARVKLETQTFPLPGRPWILGGEYQLPTHLPPIYSKDGAIITGCCMPPPPKGEKDDS